MVVRAGLASLGEQVGAPAGTRGPWVGLRRVQRGGGRLLGEQGAVSHNISPSNENFALLHFVLKAKLACYSRYLLTSYFCIPVPYDEKDIFFLVLVVESELQGSVFSWMPTQG